MITEDYVSFETAELLKEKGFDWGCETRKFYPEPEYDAESPNGVYAPTLQMAMKWLRETHSLEIYPYHDYTEGNEKWWFEIIRFRSSYAEHESGSIYLKYEEACEAAIKYCLENLI